MLTHRAPADRASTVPPLRRLREALGLTMGDAARAHGWSAADWCAHELRWDVPIDRAMVETLVAAAERKRATEQGGSIARVRVQAWDGGTWADRATWCVVGARKQIVYVMGDDERLLSFQRSTGYQRAGGSLRIHPDDVPALAVLAMQSAKPRSRDASAYPEGGRVTRGRGRPREDFTGRVVDRLTVLGPAADRNDRPHWRCRCKCKRVVIVSSDNLRAALRVDDHGQPIPGGVRSCGCLQDEARARVLRARAA